MAEYKSISKHIYYWPSWRSKKNDTPKSVSLEHQRYAF